MIKNYRKDNDFFKKYNSQQFDKPYIISNVVIFALDELVNSNYRKIPNKCLKVLLIKNNKNWELPTGYIYKNEDIEVSLKKELINKIRYNKIYLDQVNVYGDVNRDQRGRMISIGYMGLVNKISKIPLNENKDKHSKWFELKFNIITDKKEITKTGYEKKKVVELVLKSNEVKDELISKIEYIQIMKKGILHNDVKVDSINIGYDHSRIIFDIYNYLVYKLERSTLIFDLMPEKFTLMELQKTYEMILNKEYSKVNFQKKIKKYLIKTDDMRVGRGSRPASLYTYNVNWDIL